MGEKKKEQEEVILTDPAIKKAFEEKFPDCTIVEANQSDVLMSCPIKIEEKKEKE